MNTKLLINEFTLGDPSAIEFVETILEITGTWDNLVDGDVTMDTSAINSMMWAALVTLPNNDFYGRYYDALSPLITMAILNWQAANRMERSGAHSEVSYVLRSAFVDIFAMVALLIGGREHAAAMIDSIRENTHRESFADYTEALALERAIREG